jgi:sugar transferase EpsL
MLKIIFDLIVSSCVLFVFAPFILCLSILVKMQLGSPVLFVQTRPGLSGKAFRVFKFRTMTDDRNALGCLLPDGQRLTRFGHFLRTWSLDELPELLNVIKGDMSLVGPRPLLMEYLSRYDTHQARRHEVKPGITGWAQVNGRNALTWGERFELDIWYVDNRSFLIDLRILWMTVWAVLNRRGICHEGSATMEKFKGTII